MKHKKATTTAEFIPETESASMPLGQEKSFCVDPGDISYVYHPTFSLPQTEDRLWGQDREHIPVARYDLLPQVAPHATSSPAKRAPLTRQEEKVLFLRYNYARYRLAKLARKDTTTIPARRAHEARSWHMRVRNTRDKLVHANLPLVPRLAQKADIRGVDVTDLVSEGYMAVLRCVERFDVSRGFKFSTYACRSIFSAFSRLRSKARTRAKHIPGYFEPSMERSDFEQQRHDSQLAYARAAVRKILTRQDSDLTAMEQRIILERYPLLPGEMPKTLAQVSRTVGLSSERVRQIEKRSLAKLREAVEAEFIS